MHTPSPLIQSSDGEDGDSLPKSVPESKGGSKRKGEEGSSSSTLRQKEKNSKQKSKKVNRESDDDDGDDDSQVLGLNGVVNMLTGEATSDSSIFNWLENGDGDDDDDVDDDDE